MVLGKRNGKNEVKDMSFKHFNNPETGRFHRVLPYQKEEHPRRIRGPVTDAELDHFRQDRLQLRKEGGPDTYVNEIIRALTSEELEVIRMGRSSPEGCEKRRSSHRRGA